MAAEPEATPIERRRSEIREEIAALLAEFTASFAVDSDDHEPYAGSVVTAWIALADVMLPDGGRSLIQIADESSSRFHNAGMLYAALNHPSWTSS